MTENQQRADFILRKMLDTVRDDEYFADYLIDEALEPVLDMYLQDDGFGTEGQCDPRGDARDDVIYSLSGEMAGFKYDPTLDSEDDE